MKGEDKTKLWKIVSGILAALLLLSLLTNGFTNCSIKSDTIEETKNLPAISGLTFDTSDEEICTENGVPVIRLFSTKTCPHCIWIKDTFDKVAMEYAAQGKIKAYHWELDAEDNTLTAANEMNVPQSEIDIFSKYNPRGAVPLFVFGCKYTRLGNGYESEGKSGLAKEEAEFRKIIEEIVK